MRLKRLKKTFALVFIQTLVIGMLPMLAPLVAPSVKAEPELAEREQLAYQYAPIWYQDTDDSNPRGDYITKFNYDYDWIGNNNWDNKANYGLPGYIYYSLVETGTHWFIGYYSFHPQDWSDVDLAFGIDQHENDMEGLLVVIQKTWGGGAFLAMITMAHGNYSQYRDADAWPSSDVIGGHETIDGDVQFIDGHPIAYVETKGHGVRGARRWEVDGFPGGDGVVYRPTGVAEEPAGGNDRDVGYALIDISDPLEGLWGRRFDTGGSGHTFESFGVFDGDDGADDSALAPWRWDDGFKWWDPFDDDGPTFAGEFFYNPADMVDVHLDGLGWFDHKYTYNPYAVELIINWFGIGFGGVSGDTGSLGDPYITLWMKDGEGRNIKVMGAGHASAAGWVDDPVERAMGRPVKGSQANWMVWDPPARRT